MPEIARGSLNKVQGLPVDEVHSRTLGYCVKGKCLVSRGGVAFRCSD